MLNFGLAVVLMAVAALLLSLALSQIGSRVVQGAVVGQGHRFESVPVLGPILGFFLYFTGSDALLPTRERLQQRLILAGSPFGGITAREYMACNAAIAASVFAMGLLLMIAASAVGLLGLFLLPLVAVTLFWLGNEWLGNLVTERQYKLGMAFPYFLDLSVMTMEAGTSFQESIDIYVSETMRSPLTEELNSVTSSMRMGKTLQEALDDFQSRTTVEDIQGTLRAVKQGLKMGTPLSIVLRDQAETLRFRRSQSAERVAEEIKVRMQGPAMLMMISVLLLILGPAFIEMFGTGVF